MIVDLRNHHWVISMSISLLNHSQAHPFKKIVTKITLIHSLLPRCSFCEITLNVPLARPFKIHV